MAAGLALAPYLTPEKQKIVDTAMKATMKTDMGTAEKGYQQAVQAQTFRDLMQVYDPANEDKLEIAYANFTPDWNDGQFAPPAKDLGYGLHVIKKLTLGPKVIYVNEQWPSDRRTGGLFLPDAIRVRTRYLDGQRYVEGSFRDYLYDSFRVSWSNGNAEARIHRTLRYTWDAEKKRNVRLQLRIPVAAPVVCLSCHGSGTSFHEAFQQQGEDRNYEAIVQDGYFKLPVESQHGYRQYLAHLTSLGKKTDIAASDLKNAKVSMRVPRMLETLKAQVGSYDWIGEDTGLLMPGGLSQYWYRQGVYVARDGSFLLDAIEDVFEGKYHYWEPVVVVPSR